MNGVEHTVSIRVRDVPGVLSKIVNLLFRTGHNIETLTVGKTHEPGISKIVVSTPVDRTEIEALCAEMSQMRDVRSAQVLDTSRTLLQEVCMVQIGFDTPLQRMRVMDAAQPYRPVLRGVDDTSVTLEVADVPGLIDDFVQRMGEFNILDTSRTGMTALGPALPLSSSRDAESEASE